MPEILLVNKQVHLEARDTLLKSCFRDTAQIITIEQMSPRSVSNARPEPRDFNNFCSYRPVREIAPVLRSLPRIRLDVDVANGVFEAQLYTMALLRWIRAVLNERPSRSSPSHVPLKSFDVVFRLHWAGQGKFYKSRANDGLVQAIVGIKSVIEEPEVWFSTSSQRLEDLRTKNGITGLKLDVSDVPYGIWESESSAWEAMKKTCRSLEIDGGWAGVNGVTSSRFQESILGKGLRRLLGRWNTSFSIPRFIVEA